MCLQGSLNPSLNFILQILKFCFVSLDCTWTRTERSVAGYSLFRSFWSGSTKQYCQPGCQTSGRRTDIRKDLGKHPSATQGASHQIKGTNQMIQRVFCISLFRRRPFSILNTRSLDFRAECWTECASGRGGLGREEARERRGGGRKIRRRFIFALSLAQPSTFATPRWPPWILK